MRIAVIGAGISGLTVARLLKERANVTIFEMGDMPGGLIKCRRIDGCLFHTCGGHVLNSKKQNVMNWLWNLFDRDKEFTLNDRNSVVFMKDGKHIPYPIENHAYMFDDNVLKSFINDLVLVAQHQNFRPSNFEEFLKGRFGNTLYNIYFHPYNKKIWKRKLTSVPLSWLEGKLPMPTVQEMIYNNLLHVEEKTFVHSRFWYEKVGGSQYLANRLSADLDVRYNINVRSLALDNNGKWLVESEPFDYVIFCGSIKDLPLIVKGIDMKGYPDEIERLEYHGTTSVFCEIDKNPYSWIYLPSDEYDAHRIICTGNFSKTNNAKGKMTGTVEFTDYISTEEITAQLKVIPLHPKYLTHQFNNCTYPIQNTHTRMMIHNLKSYLATKNFFFTGRFADWEYYNMDVAMDAAMKTVDHINRFLLCSNEIFNPKGNIIKK